MGNSKCLDDARLLKVLGLAFRKFLDTGSRSNEKLKILHGAIAEDLGRRLGDGYAVHSLGVGDEKEYDIQGRYIDKKVDITVVWGDKIVAGIGVKFVMQNYQQNSNNDFENMLGETANIRSNRVPYFQIFIIPDTLPYYDKSRTIQKWEHFDEHNVGKYLTLADDNKDFYFHTPNKTLLYVVELPDAPEWVKTSKDYVDYYKKLKPMVVRKTRMDYGEFGPAVIFNDYETFISKVVHTIYSI